MITRRLALFRIASVSAVGAAVTAPAVIAAIQPKAAENAELLRLGQKVNKLDRICQERNRDKTAARAAYEAIVPALPEELFVTRYSKHLADAEQETDCDGEIVWPIASNLPPRRYHTTGDLKRGLQQWSGLDDEDLSLLDRNARDYLMQRLSVAERYEAGIKTAREQSGYAAASSAHFRACQALGTVAERIAKIPALTPDGITIKALAYEAWIRSGCKRAADFAAILIGPGLAADVCRVLSEGDEA